MIINGRDTNMGVYSEIHKFEASENNTYNDYFTAYWEEYRSNGKTKEDVYKEHLQTATKDRLVDIAIEGHSLYTSANDLAYTRGLEIKSLKTEIGELKNTITSYNGEIEFYQIACLSTIAICSFSILIFYIYQFIKYKLRKYADKVRSETIEEINKGY